MIRVYLEVTHADGSKTREVAQGNTPRVAGAAAAGLARQYELDGCRVAVCRLERDAR